jgi:hypothetical protein
LLSRVLMALLLLHVVLSLFTALPAIRFQLSFRYLSCFLAICAVSSLLLRFSRYLSCVTAPVTNSMLSELYLSSRYFVSFPFA